MKHRVLLYRAAFAKKKKKRKKKDFSTCDLRRGDRSSVAKRSLGSRVTKEFQVELRKRSKPRQHLFTLDWDIPLILSSTVPRFMFCTWIPVNFMEDEWMALNRDWRRVILQ